MDYDPYQQYWQGLPRVPGAVKQPDPWSMTLAAILQGIAPGLMQGMQLAQMRQQLQERPWQQAMAIGKETGEIPYSEKFPAAVKKSWPQVQPEAPPLTYQKPQGEPTTALTGEAPEVDVNKLYQSLYRQKQPQEMPPEQYAQYRPYFRGETTPQRSIETLESKKLRSQTEIKELMLQSQMTNYQTQLEARLARNEMLEKFLEQKGADAAAKIEVQKQILENSKTINALNNTIADLKGQLGDLNQRKVLPSAEQKYVEDIMNDPNLTGPQKREALLKWRESGGMQPQKLSQQAEKMALEDYQRRIKSVDDKYKQLLGVLPYKMNEKAQKELAADRAATIKTITERFKAAYPGVEFVPPTGESKPKKSLRGILFGEGE